MIKKIKSKNIVKVFIFILISILLVLLFQSIINKKILFLKYGIIEGFYNGHYKVIKIEKIGTVNDYDVYIINTKRDNSIEPTWSSSTCYYYGEHLYVHDSKKTHNVYFIKSYKIYNLKEVMEKKIIVSNDLFNVLSKKNINIIAWEEYIIPQCINLN